MKKWILNISLIILYINIYANDGIYSSSPITYKNYCLNNLIYFSPNTTTNQYISYYWDFGDASFSFDQNPIHAYEEQGEYEIILTLMKSSGTQEIFKKRITIHSFPFASIKSINECSVQTLLEDGSHSSSPLMNWEWRSNGETIGNEAHVTNNYFPGKHRVQLLVTDSRGCLDEANKFISIKPRPVLSIEEKNLCSEIREPINIDFGDDQLNIKNYSIKIDNTELTRNELSQFSFKQKGEHYIYSKVETEDGCVDSIQKTIIVKESPKVAVQIENNEGCLPMILRANSIQNNDENLNWTWSINNEIISKSNTVNQTLEKSGSYRLNVLAISENGCSYENSSKIITVYPSPILSTRLEKKIINNQAVVHIFSSDDKSEKSIDWGDGTTESYLKSASHTYSNFGFYLIKNEALNEWGCMDSLIHPIDFSNINPINIVSLVTPNGDGYNDHFKIITEFHNEMNLLVFDPLGRTVFNGSDINTGWNGIIGNQQASSGIYHYQLKSPDIDKVLYQGHFILQH